MRVLRLFGVEIERISLAMSVCAKTAVEVQRSSNAASAVLVMALLYTGARRRACDSSALSVDHMFARQRSEECLRCALWIFRPHDAAHHGDARGARCQHGRRVAGVDAAERHNRDADLRDFGGVLDRSGPERRAIAGLAHGLVDRAE